MLNESIPLHSGVRKQLQEEVPYTQHSSARDTVRRARALISSDTASFEYEYALESSHNQHAASLSGGDGFAQLFHAAGIDHHSKASVGPIDNQDGAALSGVNVQIGQSPLLERA